VASVRDKYLAPFLGTRLLAKVASAEPARLSSLQTVAHLLSDARCLFGWCEDSGRLLKSPVPRRLLPRIAGAPTRLTQVQLLLRIREPYGFIVRLGLGTGPRSGELAKA